MWNPKVEVLAYELKSLIGYGAKKQHVISRPTLRELVAERLQSNVKPQVLAQAIIESLRSTVDQMPEPEAEVCRCLLMLSRRWERDTAEARRSFAIMQLQLAISVEAFRRPNGPELDVMRELATVLIARPEEQTA